MLGTGQICLLKPGFVITGLDDVVSLDLGLKKLKKSVRYNRKFVITEFVITEFHCILHFLVITNPGYNEQIIPVPSSSL